MHPNEPLPPGVTITQEGAENLETKMEYEFGKQQDSRESRPYSGVTKELHIQFCHSGSYKGNYNQLAQNISDRYPNVMVSGTEYPTPPAKQILSKAVTFGQYGIMIMTIGGDWILRQLGITPPAIYHKIQEKKMIVVMAAMFIGGQLSNSLLTTGAFEVYLDEKLIFSKLAVGRMPSLQEIEDFIM